MAEEPVGVPREGGPLSRLPAGDARQRAGAPAPVFPPAPVTPGSPDWLPAYRPGSPVEVRVDLAAALGVTLVVSLLGVVLGALWSLLAPPQRARVLPDQVVPLTGESYHRFDDLAIFLLLCLGAGLCTGLGAWSLRHRRGPVVLVATLLGSLVAAWLAMRVGLVLAESRYALSDPPRVGTVVERAPRLESAWAVLAWPLTAALAYGGIAAWNGQDDLGRPKADR